MENGHAKDCITYNRAMIFLFEAINFANVSAWYCTEIRHEIESNKCPSAHSFYKYFPGNVCECCW